MAWGTVAVSALSLTAGIYSASEQSKAAAKAQPNLAASSKELSDTQARLLPMQRQIEAAAQQGGKVTVDNFPAHEEQFIEVPAGSHISFNGKTFMEGMAVAGIDPIMGSIKSIFGANKKKKEYQYVPYNPEDWQKGGKFEGQKIPGNIVTRQVPEGPKTFDFTGYGQADVQAKLADAQAKLGLDLSKKYDSQFIAENLKQQAEADPEGVAARAKMSDLIQSQVDRNPDRPIANMLDAQVAESLAAAKTHSLSNPDQARLDAAVADSLASRGGSGTPADFSQSITSGFVGEARDSGARQNAMSWLASGATPEDTAYRREQQNLANLSAEVNGRTPQSQFRSLTGAQTGPTPMTKGGALPVLPGGVEAASHSNTLNNYQTQQRFDANQVNPWMQGLSSLISVGGAAGQAGWKPFGTK